jgi:hypothetical protein
VASTDDPKVIAREFLQATELLVKEMVLEINAQLIETTPVKTGWARANWIPSVGRPYGEDPVGEPEDIGAAQLAQDQGQAQIAGYRINQGPLFIVNNVPYIERLNDGSSTQAPSGFVDAAVDAGIRLLDGRELS